MAGFAVISRFMLWSRMPFRSTYLLLAFWLLPFSVQAQQSDKAALRGQYDQLLQEIRKAEEVLAETKKNKQATVAELEALQRKIDIRRQLIGNISEQVSNLDNRILENTRVIISLEKDLEELKEEYANMVYYAYVNHDAFDKLGFVLASSSFTEALQRMQYFQEYSSFRKEQVKLIKATQNALSFKVTDLEVDKASKRDLLQEEERQRLTLDQERNEQSSKISTLSSIEGKLLQAINVKKKDAESLNRRIEQIIADEIRKERLKALEAANKTGDNTGSRGAEVPTLTPEMKALSSQFAENRGSLPWPLDRGTITGGFGKRLHPVLRDPPVYIQSNGIDITTVTGSMVRSIFDGEVVNIIYNPSFQRGVIIKHGEYFTVYTKLQDVSVKPGDLVKARQPVGTVHTDTEENKTELHIEIWKGTTLMNPADWLLPK